MQEIEKQIRELLDAHKTDMDLNDANDVGYLFDEINGIGALKISFDGMMNIGNPSADYSMVVNYWSDTLRKRIEIDSDDGYRFDSAEDLIQQVLKWEAEAIELEAKLKSVWK